MSYFTSILGSLCRRDANRIRKRLARWSSQTGDVIRRNLDAEHFLGHVQWQRLVQEMLKNLRLSDTGLEKEYIRICRISTGAFRMKFAGGSVRLDPIPSRLGRVVEYGFFREMLIYHYALTEDEVDNVIADLWSNDGGLHRHFGLQMHSHMVWATFAHPDEPKTNGPFGFAHGLTADALRASLGLDITNVGPDGLLVFEYDRPKSVELLRPTIADAESYEYFRPPPEHEERFGLSHPWHTGMTSLGEDEERQNIRSRPEAVHAPVLLDCVVCPVEWLR